MDTKRHNDTGQGNEMNAGPFFSVLAEYKLGTLVEADLVFRKGAEMIMSVRYWNEAANQDVFTLSDRKGGEADRQIEAGDLIRIDHSAFQWPVKAPAGILIKAIQAVDNGDSQRLLIRFCPLKDADDSWERLAAMEKENFLTLILQRERITIAILTSCMDKSVSAMDDNEWRGSNGLLQGPHPDWLDNLHWDRFLKSLHHKRRLDF